MSTTAAMSSARAARPYDIVLWGASGFTGKLVAEHIARDYMGSGLRWALAGRDNAKLIAVREGLTKINPKCEAVPILIADALDSVQIGQVLSQTTVVLSTAGPFAKFGTTIVEQCVEQGTNYCDITGEIQWVKRSVKNFGDKAAAKGVRVVHCCGYDSVPSDMGALMMVDYIKRELGKKTDKVYTMVGLGKGGVSGGTIASAKNIIATEPMAELSACASDAYYLAETVEGCTKGGAKPAPMRPTRFDDVDGGTWAGPWLMEGVNARIVQYSNALVKEPYGSDFKYIEALNAGKGWSGFATANTMALTLGVIGLGLTVPGLKTIFNYVAPAPGQGPSEEARKSGRWKHELVALTEEEPGVAPVVVKGVCGDSRDPGYWSTSRMILEAGLCMVLDDAKLKASGCAQGGVLTASAALGMTLVERLRAAGFTFKVTEVGGKPVA
ncbi:hypothetical protein FOA52_013533 [Chlamydomonas sp. UWO 241]|nr:hypothetical protein FOA52_013533 [Chlamydomonas sp. UWO 241]